ncbi:MAG: AmmeMemoRadiSam system protein B [Nitrospinota bacterium]
MDCPRLRPLEVTPTVHQGQKLLMLRDPQHFTDAVALVPLEFAFVLERLDGHHTVRDIQADYMRAYGELLYSEQIEKLISDLDQALLLESERFAGHRERLLQEFLSSPSRAPFLAGRTYEADPERLRATIRTFYQPPEGPGLPGTNGQLVRGPLRAAVAPHIDFHRGGPTFAWTYRALEEACGADLFAVMGTGHALAGSSFALTRKDFETPLGTLRTDRAFVDRLAAGCRADLFAEEFAQRAEHSVEFQAVLLRFLLESRGAGAQEASFVPILCGSFHDLVLNSVKSPLSDPAVAEFIESLRAAIAASEREGRKVCLIASADLAHVGPRFGDPLPLQPSDFARLERQDRAMLEHVARGDAEGFFAIVRAEEDRRRVCGLSSIYVLLSALGGVRGELLKYSQWPDPHGTVTFCSMAFR